MTTDREPVSSPQSVEHTTRIAVIIPIYNEAATLGAVLQSLATQDYPGHLLEVLIVDGGSNDDWQAIVAEAASGIPTISILKNPARTTPAAVNLALRATDAAAVLWISGHCLLAPDYISRVATAFKAHDRVVVGGRLCVEGDGFAGTLNALVLKSPIGTGLAPWRYHQASPWVSRVNFALFDRQMLLDMGGLDERLARNQDNDLMRRLEEGGVRFYQVDSTVRYLAPRSLAGLWRRAWGNASWTIWCWRLGKPSAEWYHLVPMMVVLLGAILLAASFYSTSAGIVLSVLALTYLILALVHTIMVAIPGGQIWAIPLVPIHLFIFHVVYGLGGWAALLRPVPRPS